MAYEASKDKVLKHFELESDGGRFFTVSLFSYDGGEIKLQFGRYQVNDKGEPKYMKAGRMNTAEFRFFSGLTDQIESIMADQHSEMS